MSWPILAIISIFTVSIATLLERVLMKGEESDPISYAIVFQFALGLISFVFALLFGKFVLPNLEGLTLRFILSAFLWAGATVFSFKAIKTLSAGELTILTTSSSVIAMLLGVIFLKELFSLKIAIGALLVFLSIWILNSKKLSFNSKQGVMFALISAFCAGIAVVNDAFILKTYEAFSYTAIMSILPGVILSLLFPKKLAKTKELLNPKSIKLMFIFCLFYSIQAITYYLAFQNGAPVSQLSPLTKSSIVLTVILGAIFLNERKDLMRKIIASLVVTNGAILLG
ncbi:hypothetical protein A2954_00665 [Candidatus Roizmanbacteria bacterium RIFCSPLOWO2_01_FULL_37_12]|uniref:EamA domain-containing protein n=1 Tax=Candidatus Roizmanbacteria bacterium RIFCSPLOWO2_01_FULL_37_12 TaxID=1802056 RepID=A0A1F7IDS3_9BACT|nr:MAG: hypothetical protein A2954_00665 [Candidatus Roizmanbacteria bacterium RIFCSPLOWO2_01_FULL_37_12]